jgi:predicted O-methyltransferase YrrM
MNHKYDFSSDWFSRHIPTWNLLIPARVGQVDKVMEIGSYEGRSTVWIIDNLLSGPGSQIYCIDTWEDRDLEARFNKNSRIALSKRNGVRLEKLKGCSAECASRLMSSGHRNTFDLIYIDGSHEAPDVLTDLCYSFNLCRIGGLLICDDYLGGDWGSKRDPIRLPKIAIDAFTNVYARKISVLEAHLYQMYIIKSAD